MGDFGVHLSIFIIFFKILTCTTASDSSWSDPFSSSSLSKLSVDPESDRFHSVNDHFDSIPFSSSQTHNDLFDNFFGSSSLSSDPFSSTLGSTSPFGSTTPFSGTSPFSSNLFGSKSSTSPFGSSSLFDIPIQSSTPGIPLGSDCPDCTTSTVIKKKYKDSDSNTFTHHSVTVTSNYPLPLAAPPTADSHLSMADSSSDEDSSYYKPATDSHFPGAMGVGSGALAGAAAGAALGVAASKRPRPLVPPISQNPLSEDYSGKCNYCTRSKCTPTVKPYPNFDVAIDCEILHKAMKGAGTKEDDLINILTKRSDDQIKEIVNQYTKKGKTLADDIKGDTSLKFKSLLLALITPLPLFYAEELHKAMEKKETGTMIEILTSLSDCAIREVSVEYQKKYDKSLPSQIKAAPKLENKNFLFALAKGDRPESREVDKAAASRDAQELLRAGVAKKIGTDDQKFIEIFAYRSFPQLKEILRQYDANRKAQKSSIDLDIKNQFKNNELGKALQDMVRNIKNQPRYFADQLNESLKGLFTPKDNDKLIRIMRGRSGIDLEDIQQNFDGRYSDKLAQRVSHDTYLEYRRALLSLLNKDPSKY